MGLLPAIKLWIKCFSSTGIYQGGWSLPGGDHRTIWYFSTFFWNQWAQKKSLPGRLKLGYRLSRPTPHFWSTLPPPCSSWGRRRKRVMSTFFLGLGNLICWRNNSRLFLKEQQLPFFFFSHHCHHFLSPFSPWPIWQETKQVSESFSLTRTTSHHQHWKAASKECLSASFGTRVVSLFFKSLLQSLFLKV